MPPSEVRIQLPDRYRVVRHVANGGMAAVWAAEDSVLGRLVAVKILAQHVAADPSARTRFEREARTAARVSDHPNVATIYDVGEHDENAFIVMELFTGGTIADRLRESRSIPRSQAITWLAQAAEALDYGHGRDVVHRDVKPANLLLDDRDRLAVADFGIARLVDDSSLTQAGQVLGTAAYLSPEQALGRSATAASDRYALGVVAFELLTGGRPFQGEHAAAQARQHVEESMPESGISDEIDEVLCRAMAKEPADRYPTAARFVEELKHASTRTGQRSAPTAATKRVEPPPPPTPTPAPSRRMSPMADEPARKGAPAAAPAPAARAADLEEPPQFARQRAGRGKRGWLALAAVALVALVVAGAVLLGGSGGDGSSSSEPTSAEREQPKAERDSGSSSQSGSDEPEASAPSTPAPSEETPSSGSGGDSSRSETPDTESESGAGEPAPSPAQARSLNDRGYALLQAGNPQEARPLLERAVKGFEAQGGSADPTTYGYALFNLGNAYEKTGRPDEAVTMYERRLQVNPSDRPGVVRQAIARAKRQS